MNANAKPHGGTMKASSIKRAIAVSSVRRGIAATIATLALAAMPIGASAQLAVPITSLTFPTVTNTAGDIIAAKGLDKKNGLVAEFKTYGAVGAMYSGIAKGEAVAGVMAPYQVVKMRAEGVPLAIFATFVDMDDTHIVTKNPDIKTFQDMKGKSIAATVGFSSYQYLQIYSRKFGLALGSDIQVVNANTALAQAQLEADRVDTALLWEPATTRALSQIKGLRIIMTGGEAWKKVTGDRGWDIIAFINTDFAKKNPGVLAKLVAMYQGYADILINQPDEADAIISSDKYVSRGLPPGVIATAVKAKRLIPEIRPSWDPAANKQIWQMLELGVQESFIGAPPRDVVYNDAPAG